MGYIKFIDGLPRIAKILIVIFLDVLVFIYRIIKDAMDGHIVAIILDIFLGFIAWIMATLEGNGSYTKGTADNPTTIELEYIFRYQTTIDNIGSILKYNIETVFNTACPGYKLVINETVGGASYTDTYDRMDRGEYDFADGAIQGNTLGTLSFMIICGSLIVSLLMICFNLFGNGLRDAFNPSLKGVSE